MMIFILVGMNLLFCQKVEKIPHTFTDDGAWCWFSDPRAIYHHSGGRTTIISGWVKSDGSIEAGELDPVSGTVRSQVLALRLEKDDHVNPAFTELPGGQLMVAYVKHTDDTFRYHLGNYAVEGQIFGESRYSIPFSEEELKRFPLRRLTYANPFTLSAEGNRVYCMGRWTGFKPNIMWSDDGGNSWSTSRVFITNYPFEQGNRPYVKYYSDGESKIHVVFTDGHPRNEHTNSVYYVCYEKGAFWRADGSKICDMEDLPFEPKDATQVYQANEQSGKSWVFDLAADENGYPVILYARYPDDENHIYHYARYDGSEWTDHEICNSGRWFPQTREGEIEREPNYSGGLTIHPLHSNEVYVSRQVNGIFEIQRAVTLDRGKNWEFTSLTENSGYDNVRPFFPRNMQKGDPDILLWMRNRKYVHYTDYQSEILYRQIH